MSAQSTNKRFRLYLFGSEIEYKLMKSNMDKLRHYCNERTQQKRSLAILNHCISEFLKSESSMTNDNQQSAEHEHAHHTSKPTQEEDLTVCTQSALRILNGVIFDHNLKCKHQLLMSLYPKLSCGKIYQLTCPHCNFHYTWNTSTDLPGGKDLVTARLVHGYCSSGMQRVQLDRFLLSTGIGNLSSRDLKKYTEDYSQHVLAEKQSSIRIALTEELASINDGENIDIVTDARHSTRRNSRYTDVVCVGYSSKKILVNEVVSRTDDTCSQRHELIGTKAIYNHLNEMNVSVRRHGHDNNASINKYIRENHTDTENQNDTWHVSVSIEKKMKSISSGAKCREGKTWSIQLSDKVGPVKTHVQYAMKNCNGDKDKLVSMLDNIVQHYENKHENCNSSSRCKQDKNYIPGRQIITDSFAKHLLSSTIQFFDVYKKPQNYVHAMHTSSVESFNNTLNVFHDKRVGAISHNQYVMRSNLAVCHWNENIISASKAVSYKYRDNIWARWMSSISSSELWRPF